MFNVLFKENADLKEQKVQPALTSKKVRCVALTKVSKRPKRKKYKNKPLF
jgi:hypothetical protein